VGNPNRVDLPELQKCVEKGGLSISGLTAQTAGFKERDLASPERDLRSDAVEYYRACIDLAVRLGAPNIGLHPSAEGRAEPITSYKREWQLAVRATREIAHYAGERGCSIAVEPLNRYETFLVNRVDQAMAFIADVDMPCMGIVADLFHMNIEEADVRSALELGLDRLLEIHLADSNRRGLGQGHLPVGELLSVVASREGPRVMEFTARSKDELDHYLRESAVIVNQTPRDAQADGRTRE
jgi:sugar phosphate isomerase/epimerase